MSRRARVFLEALAWATAAVVIVALAASIATALGAGPFRANATSYCLRGTMADGTYTRARSAASNRHPLGTRIRLTGRPGPGGLRLYVIRDRIGHGSELDLWAPTCGASLRFGRRTLTYRIGWRR